MTCNVEEVREDETLGSSLPVQLYVSGGCCVTCSADKRVCDKCGSNFCVDCEDGTDS